MQFEQGIWLSSARLYPAAAQLIYQDISHIFVTKTKTETKMIIKTKVLGSLTKWNCHSVNAAKPSTLFVVDYMFRCSNFSSTFSAM